MKNGSNRILGLAGLALALGLGYGFGSEEKKVPAAGEPTAVGAGAIDAHADGDCAKAEADCPKGAADCAKAHAKNGKHSQADCPKGADCHKSGKCDKHKAGKTGPAPGKSGSAEPEAKPAEKS